MKFKTSISKTVELAEERKAHITAEHPELEDHFKRLRIALLKPDQIRISKIDPSVLLFYKYFDKIKQGLYIAVAVKLTKVLF